MKIKLLTLILALATLLTFTACGEDAKESDNEKDTTVSESTESTQSGDNTDNSDATVSDGSDTSSTVSEEENAFPFAGTWKRIQESAYVYDGTIVIDNMGNITYTSGDHTSKCVLDEDNEEIVLDDIVSLKYERENGRYYGEISFIKVGDVYGMQFPFGSSEYYFYRESDINFDDYIEVELTSENISEYIEAVVWSKMVTDKFGETTIRAFESFRFKEGLGIPSFVLADDMIHSQQHCKMIYDSNSGETTIEEVYEVRNDTFYEHLQTCVPEAAYPDYSGLYTTPDYIDNGDGTYTIESIWIDVVTGAEKIYGKVYVPKDWNK